MTLAVVPQLDEEILVQDDDDDPRCEVVYECPDHGEESCDSRARWVAILSCPRRGNSEVLLVCDECHDMITANGNVLGGDHTVEWRPL